MYNPYFTLCTLREHSFPPSIVRRTREGVPGRPQLPSGALVACNFTGQPIGLMTSVQLQCSSVCESYGQRAWQELSVAVFTIPSKALAGISECSVVVSPAPRSFSCGQRSVLVFGIWKNGRFICPQHTWPPLPSSR